MTRRERIVVLLENYIDVVYGLRDRSGDGVHLPLMCRAYNKPKLGYPELERLKGKLRTEQPTMYRHLAGAYFRSETRRVLQCPRCQGIVPSWSSINFHRHSHTNVAIVPRVIRITPEYVADGKVQEAIAWLDEQWQEPGPFLPDELKPAKKEKTA